MGGARATAAERGCWAGMLLRSLFVSLLAAGLVHAQVSASISGRVEDASGAGVGGATVTVTSLETGATRTAITSETGNFRVLALAVGLQEVKAEKKGFKPRSGPESIWKSGRKRW